MVYARIVPMYRLLRVALIVVCLAWTIALASAGSFGAASLAQGDTPAARLLQLINEARLNEGLDPYGLSRLLTNAAQRHASDVVENGFADPDNVHLGSDGTDYEERIDEAGYAAWTEDGEQRVVGENVWLGEGSPQDALAHFLDDATFRENLLSDAYREIGVGFGTDAEGDSVFVLDFGARPNVLPIFVNDGAASTENPEVAIRLTNEQVRPEGKGASFIGEAIEIRMSNEPSFEDLPWQPWAPLVSWTLPDTSGEHTVYVQFRDAAGRTAASADGIVLDRGTPAAATAEPATATPTAPVISTPGLSSPTAESAVTPEASPSSAASPASPSSSPSPSSGAALLATPFPTWTPLPSPEPTRDDPAGEADTNLSIPKMNDYARPLTVVGILQGVVIVLGLLWLLIRGRTG